MEDFSREQNGYSVREVDRTLSRLRREYQSKLEQKESKISSLEQKIKNLQDIVMDYVQREEKTQKVLDSSNNLRVLETQRLQLLYKKWQKTLEQLRGKVVPILSQEELVNLTQDFQYALQVVVDSSKLEISDTKSYAKSVLSRMSGIFPMKVESEKEVKAKEVGSSFAKKEKNKTEKNVEVREEKKKDPSSAEKFLNGEGIEMPKSMGIGKEMFSIPPKEFTDNLPTERAEGFSLEEALVPTESLSEIMSVFNLEDTEQ